MHAYVITGFLGVGKTTLLTHTVKHHFKEKQVAIIVNEFGDVGIDSKILSNVHSEVLEISEGCICCKLAEEFEKGVQEIIATYAPEILFVETSGASEPFPIFLSLQNLGITVEGVICICDAANFETYSEHETARYQLGGANVIVLNKIDLVDAAQKAQVTARIGELKSRYNLKNNLTGETIFKNYVLYEAQQGIVDKAVFEGAYAPAELIALAQEDRHDHTSAVTQQMLRLDDGITFEAVEQLLNALPENIYRVKGIIHTCDVDEALIVNYAFGNVTFEPLPDYQGGALLIFIGSAIDVAPLMDTFTFLHLPRFRVAP